MIILKILLIILAVLLLLALWILVVPVVLYINTERNVYYLKLVSIAKACLIFNENDLYIRIRVFFMSFSINPLKLSKKKKKEKEKEKKKKKPSSKKKIGKSFNAGRKMIAEFFRSFKIREFYVEIDTGDVIKNAYLYPVSSIIPHDKLEFSVNNNGTNIARINIQNRLINFLYIFLRFYFRSK